jgi:RNA polymerase sigma factor (sigma-70 family)
MEEGPANQDLANAVDCAEDIHLYFSNEDNLLSVKGIICSALKRSSLSFSSEATLKDMAGDVLSDVMETAIRKADSYYGGSVGAWVRAIAMNHVKQKQDQIIKQQTREKSIEALSEHSASPKGRDAFYEYYHANLQADPQQQVGVREQLDRALACLSLDDRDIVLLRYQGYAHEEIAQRLGISSGAVRVRHSRAVERLRACWQQLEDDKRGENYE